MQVKLYGRHLSRSTMKNVRHIYCKYVYSRLHLLAVVIHFEYNNSETQLAFFINL